jgi:hypothetical protein
MWNTLNEATAPLQAPPMPAQENADQAAPAVTKESLEAKMKEFAPFAADAYGTDGNGGGRKGVAGYHFDPTYTNGNRALYVSDTDPSKAVLAFRGTSVHNWGDIGTDVLNTIGLNRFSARNQNAARAAKAAQAKYSNLSLVGHSLGGEETLYAAKSLSKPPAQAIAFSPHVNYFQALGDKVGNFVHNLFWKKTERQPNNTTIFKTDTDPVTAYVSDHYANATVCTVKEVDRLNPHSMANFYTPN